jgi:lipopolysaccharide/colanic/teichoic acid biosynthesis glycosyltransferase
MSALPDSRDDFVEVDLRPLWLPRRAPFKRIVDVVLGGILLTLALPILACLVVIIRLDSPGPALYGQRRIGHLGRPFTLWKLRSMYHHSSQTYHLQAAQDWFKEQRSGERYKTESDPRITRIGKYLRRSSLDELPQLFNVLRGDMSLVGPRPLMPYDRPSYKSWYFEREVMRPGITGLWQVSGRAELDFDELVRLDFLYLERWSIMLDLSILLKTIPAVLSRRGAF